MDRSAYEHYQMQEALQKGQLDSQQFYTTPQVYEQMQQQQAVMVEQTDPKKVIKEVLFTLKGVEEQPDGTLIRISAPKLNEKGIEAMWFWLKSHINQNTILSHYTDKQIRAIIDVLQKDFVNELTLCWKEYGIKIASKPNLDSINDCVLGNINSAYRRAEGQGEKNWLGKISVEQISGASKLPPFKKEGFWSKFRL